MATKRSLVQSGSWNDILNWIKPGDQRYQFLARNLVDRVYPNLRQQDKLLLLDGLTKTINLIYLKFGFNGKDEILWNQLTQNNLLDARSLLNILLPFIDDTTTDDKKRSLIALEDLYLKKDARGQFIYTNCQYNRCVRHREGRITQVFNRPYITDYFVQHLELLLMSIETLANKLYVNWVDVLPARMDRYRSTALYQETVKKIVGRIDTDVSGNRTAVRDTPINQIRLVNNYIDPNPGISYQDVYNVMSNHLYHEIKNCRWLIYDIMIENRPITYLAYLEKRINLDRFWKGILWSQLTKNEQSHFHYQWSNFLSSTNPNDNTVLHHFFFYFSKYHLNARKLIKQGKLILEHEPTDEEEEEEETTRITPEMTRNAKRGLANIPMEEIYLFFHNQLSVFRKTWFYYFIRIERTNSDPYLEKRNGIYVTPKNIYNYCKSLVHFVKDKKFVQMPRLWYSLKPEWAELVLIRILDIPVVGINEWEKPNWFNINRYLRKLYPTITEDRLVETNFLIHSIIRTQLVDIIFQSLIYHGLLSEFRPNPSITNNRLVEELVGMDMVKQRDERYKQMKYQYFAKENGKSYRNHAYYYLTCATYGELQPDYFDYLTSGQIWTFTYAMNWVSQINFFHHYLNNRVQYITGATGVGKSTQVPKLLLYSQKMLDYNPHGKIICTQPRIPPTVSNAETISRELGVPIRIYNPTYDRPIFTGNYYIQFKHQQEEHTAKTDSFLRIVTDGTLYEEMKRSPFLTRSKQDTAATNQQGKSLEWAKVYLYGNKYDCIIVDEAHEHNANMDMILTLGRDAAYVNNSLKLIIVSATMEDDEPIYRRYYRNINDNRAYPLSAFIENQNLDRANMDRRIHISPPGGTTQFAIRDIYLSKAEANLINEKNYLEFAIKKTIELANSTIQGDILLFVTGISDIQAAVSQINSSTPANMIALAFYGQQTEEEKAMITNIHKTLPSYTRCKDDIFLDEKEVTCRVPTGTYNRAIIIATNVAEASLTLQNLRYVVDPGYAKTVVFDPLEGINRELILPISQSSSVQRRGRVGRVAPGEVYYLYDREKIINNKTAYKIADQDVKDHLVSLLRSDAHDTFIITYENDINDITILQKIIELRASGQYSSETLVYQILRNPRPYLDIIQKQYLYIPDLTDINQYYTYYGKTDMEDYTLASLLADFKEYLVRNHDDYHYQKEERFLSRGHTGYDDLILEDPNLSFYLIHPEENVIVRNLFTGQMVGLKCSPLVSNGYYYYLLKNNNINMADVNIPQCRFSDINFENFKLLKYDLAITDAKLQLLVFDINLMSISANVYYTNITDPIIQRYIQDFFTEVNRILKSIHEDNMVIKSNILSSLKEIQTMTNLRILSDLNHLFWYSYAIPYELEEDVIALIVLINTVPDLKQWIGPEKDVEKFISLHSNNQGDIYFLWVLWNRIKEVLEKNEIYGMAKIDIKLENQFKRYKEQYLRNVKIPFEQFLIFEKLYTAGQLNTEDEYYYYLSHLTLNSNELVKASTINKLLSIIAGDYKLNANSLSSFLSAYLDVLFTQNKRKWMNQYQLEKSLLEDDEQGEIPDPIGWAKKRLLFSRINSIITNPNYVITRWDRILETYIRAFSTNLMKNETSHYLRINKGIRMDPIIWSKRFPIETTFLNNKTDFIIYHNTQSTAETVSPIYLTPVKIEWVINLNPIYYYYFFLDKNNSLFTMYPDEDVIRSIKLLTSNKHLFDRSVLQAYLEQFDITLDET